MTLGYTGGSAGGAVDLADAITLLRDQIAEAQRRIATPPGHTVGADRGVLFTVGEITLELGLELTESKGADGGLRWSVVSFGGRKDSGRTTTHTVTVTLTPQGPGGGHIEVDDTE
jgi:hypothetical protein